MLAIDGANLPALKSLAALYRREGEWEKLIAVLQHHATLTEDRREVFSLKVEVGEGRCLPLDQAPRGGASGSSR